jgi:hypothetical protein
LRNSSAIFFKKTSEEDNYDEDGTVNILKFWYEMLERPAVPPA